MSRRQLVLDLEAPTRFGEAMKLYTVEGCNDCPLFADDWDFGDDVCHHPGRPKDVEPYILDINAAPDWCPLRRGSLTISMQLEAQP